MTTLAEELKITRAISSPTQRERMNCVGQQIIELGSGSDRLVATFSRVIMVIMGRIVLMTSKKAGGVISMSYPDKNGIEHTITQETGKPRGISECEAKHLVAGKIRNVERLG